MEKLKLRFNITLLLASANVAALAVSTFCSGAMAAKPITVQQKNVSTTKKVEVTSNNSNSAQLASGKILFERLTCAGCHPNGENTLHPYRPLKGPTFQARYKDDGQIEHLIRTGVPRAGMPSFSKTQVSDKEMKDLIAYIRSFTTNLKK